MRTIKPSGEDYFDATGVYDSSLMKNQQEVNAEAIASARHLPYPGTNGTWMVWNASTGAYVDSGEPSRGADGADGAKGDPGDPAPTSAVAPAVAAWLEENVTVEEGVAIDASLSVAGAAADSKTVGDKFTESEAEISDLKSDIDLSEIFSEIVQTYTMSDFTWADGYINDSGVLVSHASYKSTEKIDVAPGDVVEYANVRAPADFYPAVACYNGNTYIRSASLIGASYTSYTNGSFVVPEGVNKIILVTYYNTSYSVSANIKGETATIPILAGRIEDISSDNIVYVENKDGYSKAAQYTKAYLDTSGNNVSYANAYVSDYIPVVGGDSIECKLAYIYGIAIAACFYDENKAFIAGSAITASTGTAGSWAVASGTHDIPATAAYMKYSMALNSVGGILASDQFIIYKKAMPLKEYVTNYIAPTSGGQWAGKKWCAFGTSITDTSYTNPETGEPTGRYVPFLVDISGLNVTNRGIAGGTLARGGIHGGSANILNAILNSNDLDTFDLITIEGFVNDFAAANTVGDVGDTGDTTFCGALHQAISYCLEHSHAEVCLITETTGKVYQMSGGSTADYTILRKNSLDLYQQDYNNAIIKMGQYYGVHVIDAGGKSQINQYHPQYIIDQIHHTSLGGEQYAKTIWEELKNITPAKGE